MASSCRWSLRSPAEHKKLTVITPPVKPVKLEIAGKESRGADALMKALQGIYIYVRTYVYTSQATSSQEPEIQVKLAVM